MSSLEEDEIISDLMKMEKIALCGFLFHLANGFKTQRASSGTKADRRAYAELSEQLFVAFDKFKPYAYSK